MHIFDYNADHLGLGTIDAPEWKIDDRAKAYATRSAAARAGLFGNHGYEANYELVYVDADGEQLNGAHRYELRLDTMPPVDAFWSLTMYNVPRFLLVANPIDRYSIGDRTPGLNIAADGSLTIYLQHDSPGAEKESNWLPTPEGDFRPVMRMYQPKPGDPRRRLLAPGDPQDRLRAATSARRYTRSSRPTTQTAGTGRRSSTSTRSTRNPPSRSRSASSFARSRARSGPVWRASQKR